MKKFAYIVFISLFVCIIQICCTYNVNNNFALANISNSSNRIYNIETNTNLVATSTSTAEISQTLNRKNVNLDNHSVNILVQIEKFSINFLQVCAKILESGNTAQKIFLSELRPHAP